jgi:hypothetical protein
MIIPFSWHGLTISAEITEIIDILDILDILECLEIIEIIEIIEISILRFLLAQEKSLSRVVIRLGRSFKICRQRFRCLKDE